MDTFPIYLWHETNIEAAIEDAERNGEVDGYDEPDTYDGYDEWDAPETEDD